MVKIVSYFCKSLLSLISGLGCGLVYVPAVTIPSYMFNKNSNLAVGISVSGVCAGQLVCPFILNYIFNEFGWHGSMLILSGLNLQICVCASLMSPRITREWQSENKSISQWNWIICKNIGMLAVYLSNIAFDFGLILITLHLPAHGISKGLSELQAVSLISALGASNFVGRIFLGLISAHYAILANALFTVLVGVFTLIFILCSTYWHFFICAISHGFASAAFVTFTNSTIINLIGMENVAAGLGCALMAGGVSALASGPIAGELLLLELFTK